MRQIDLETLHLKSLPLVPLLHILILFSPGFQSSDVDCDLCLLKLHQETPVAYS